VLRTNAEPTTATSTSPVKLHYKSEKAFARQEFSLTESTNRQYCKLTLSSSKIQMQLIVLPWVEGPGSPQQLPRTESVGDRRSDYTGGPVTDSLNLTISQQHTYRLG
jgi:hypothetical protein